MEAKIIKRVNYTLNPNPTRVLIRFFNPGENLRVTRILARIMELREHEVKKELTHVVQKFKNRHQDINSLFYEHFNKVKPYLMTDISFSDDRKQLIGAYFTSEYSLESAALFNPSIVSHFDQSGLPEGSTRFIMSLRATGEGHISSIEFRSGTIDLKNRITIDEPGEFVSDPEIIENPTYDKKSFEMKLFEIGIDNEYSDEIMNGLENNFSFDSLDERLKQIQHSKGNKTQRFNETIDAIKWLAQSNHEVEFNPDVKLSERVIFPYFTTERKGIEDARFVRFREENGQYIYYATYTAFDGKNFLPQLVETKNFLHFKFITLNGVAVQNKGMALFPRKINGKYAMISRQDNENLFIMYSDDIYLWRETKVLIKPSYSWEFIQIGNCGSPIETEKGWLLITHGVGAMRRYCIGAVLLDKNDPSKIIGRLKVPLIEPDEEEREGYVPNVVYTCGAMLHQNKTLLIPYAMSDYATTFGIADLNTLLNRLLTNS